VPIEWIVPCAVEQPPLVIDRPVAAADVAAAEAQQAWLGTTVVLSDRDAGEPDAADETTSGTGRWLVSHGAAYGFVPALAESAAGRAIGREPWTWRWVGREMALRLQPLVANPAYSREALAQLRAAQAELTALDPARDQPPLWGLADNCWTIATSSGRGCPSRWNFLPIPFT
jgi:hypothetical protein